MTTILFQQLKDQGDMAQKEQLQFKLENMFLLIPIFPAELHIYTDCEFLDELAQGEEIWHKYASSKIVLAGDLNVDLDQQQTVRTRALKQIMNILQLEDITPKSKQAFFHHSGVSSSKIYYILFNQNMKM